MSILTTGPIVNEIRGSVGSRTFSRNAYGPYVKNKLVQTNPNTAKQIGRRNALKTAVSTWQNFTDTERRQWTNWAKDNPIRNSLGKKVILSGYNMFISAYMNKHTINTLGTPFQFIKEPFPATTRGNIFGTFNPLVWDFMWINGNGWFYAAMFIAPQRPVSKGFVNPSELKFYGRTPAQGFINFEFETINNLMGFPTFVRDSDLFTPVGIRIIDLRSGLASSLYITRLQSIPNGKIY